MRLIFARLAVSGQTMPMPDRDNRLFSADGESIDADSPFWLACLADGSVVEAAPAKPAATPDATPPAKPSATPFAARPDAAPDAARG